MFSPNLQYIDMSDNKIFWIPQLPASLIEADFSNNSINIITNNINNNYKTGKLIEGNFKIKLLNNPLMNVNIEILNDPRVIHNKAQIQNKYIQIIFEKNIEI